MMREIQQSHEINELAKALSNVQSKLGHAKKDSKNPHFKSDYADIASVWDACRQLLFENDFSIVQTNNPNEKGIELTTTLMHSSGQWIKGTIFIPCDRQGGPHGFGSAMTYARRYTLAAIVGVYQDDDDVNAAASGDKKEQNTASAKLINKEQESIIRNLITLCAAHQENVEQGTLKYFKVESISKLPADLFEKAKGILEKKLSAFGAEEKCQPQKTEIEIE